jgi:TonB-linked SusC/RagA family outer membrane protein
MKRGGIAIACSVLLHGILLGKPTYAQAYTSLSSPSQTTRPANNTSRPLKDVLRDLKRLYGVNFLYENPIITGRNTDYQVDEKQQNLEVVLRDLFVNTPGLRYVKLDDKNYSIVTMHKVKQVTTAEDAATDNPTPVSPYAMNTLVKPVAAGSGATVMDQVISGRVLSANNRQPLEGALVGAKGTTVGVYTNSKGAFTLRVPTGTEYIEIRYLGYKSATIKIVGLNVEVFLLEPDLKSIKEVVVNGLYERPKENYTGTARTFTADQLFQISNKNVLAAVRSLDPSFQLPENINLGSNPNALPNVQVRGANSLPNVKGAYVANPNLPLFVLDGFIVPLERIYDLDMNRVERLTVLKDAAATAIYGARAANGVVVIDTKRPDKGRLRVTYNTNLSLSTPDLTSYKLLNASEKLEVEKAGGIYSGANNNQTVNTENRYLLEKLYNYRLAEAARGVNTDWLSKPVHTAFGQKHGLYVEGGDDYIRYGIDFAYNNDNAGVMKGSGRTNYSGGVNFSYRHKKLLFTNYLMINYNQAKNSPYGSFGDYARLNPYWRPQDENGNMLKIMEYYPELDVFPLPTAPVFNPLYNATLNTRDNSNYMNVSNNFSLQWNVLADLKAEARFSLNKQSSQADFFRSAEHTDYATGYTGEDYFRRGVYRQTIGNLLNYQGDLLLNYGKAVGKNSLFVSGGMHLEQFDSNNATTVAEGFPNDNMDDIKFGYQYEKNGKPYGEEALTRAMGLLVNASYSYDNRYLLDASFRTDGSSQFGSNKRFAPFWSVGAGWNLHKEAFMQQQSVINQFKLRASYGSTGSQNFPAYMSLSSYKYYTDKRYRNGLGAVLQGLANPNLQWQQTLKINLGTDIVLWKNRIAISANYYNEKAKSLIMPVSTPPSMGFGQYYENLGNVQNSGVELYTTVFVWKQEQRNIYWSVTGALHHNKNKILNISNALNQQNNDQKNSYTDPKGTNAQNNSPVVLLEEGQSQSAIYAVRSLGIDPTNGYEVFVKKDGSLTYQWDPRDMVVVGDGQPKLTGTFGTNLMYKGFSVNVNMRMNVGGDAYNQTLVDRVENANLYYNVDRRVYDQRWRKPGDVTFYKGLTNIYGDTRTDATRVSSRFVQRNNSLYMDAITLGYEFPRALIQDYRMQQLKVTGYINNPFVVSTVQQERGLDYPFARTYSLTLQATF